MKRIVLATLVCTIFCLVAVADSAWARGGGGGGAHGGGGGGWHGGGGGGWHGGGGGGAVHAAFAGGYHGGGFAHAPVFHGGTTAVGPFHGVAMARPGVRFAPGAGIALAGFRHGFVPGHFASHLPFPLRRFGFPAAAAAIALGGYGYGYPVDYSYGDTGGDEGYVVTGVEPACTQFPAIVATPYGPQSAIVTQCY